VLVSFIGMDRGGREVGMDEYAGWLQAFVTEALIKLIPSRDPFGFQPDDWRRREADTF
jgi:hypothetical protein